MANTQAVSTVRVKMRVLFAHPLYLGVDVAEGSASVAGGGATRVALANGSVCSVIRGWSVATG